MRRFLLVFTAVAYYPVHMHTIQFNLDLVEEGFGRAGSHSSIGVVKPLAAVDAYAGPDGFGRTAINAPINCQGQNTHEGCFTFFDGTFDPNRCADTCTNQTRYNLARGFTDRPCRFFNTFRLYKNGVRYAQYCSLVSEGRACLKRQDLTLITTVYAKMEFHLRNQHRPDRYRRFQLHRF